jgi:PPOX class probable F420-dependent enzyme
MRLTKKVAKLIAAERVCRVATAGRDGRPHVVPVCPALAGQKIYFGSGKEAAKVTNLEENPRIALTVDVYSEDWSRLIGVMVQGTARLITRGREFQRARARLYEKFPQYSREAALAASDSVIVEVTPTKVVTWGLD